MSEAREQFNGHYDGLNEGSYIKAAEFKTGQEFTVTIDAVHREKLEGDDGKKKGKGVVAFKGKDKEWVSNKTNQILIAAMFGPMVKDWIGKQVTLVVEQVNVGGEKKPGFRVKGSPQLTAPIEATIKLPRRKPVKRQLVPTGRPGSAQAPAPKMDAPPPPEPDEIPDSDSLNDMPPDMDGAA